MSETPWPTLRELRAAVPVHVAAWGHDRAAEELLHLMIENGWEREDAVPTLSAVMADFEASR